MKSITIDGVEYVPAADREPSHVQIVVLDRGWIVVGYTEQTAATLIIKKAQVIRRWGTSKGLGELATLGPRPNTTLDSAGIVRAPIGSVVCTFDCDATAWEASLS